MALFQTNITTHIYNYVQNQNHLQERAPRRKKITSQEVKVDGLNSFLFLLTTGRSYLWEKADLNSFRSLSHNLFELSAPPSGPNSATNQPNKVKVVQKSNSLKIQWFYSYFIQNDNGERTYSEVLLSDLPLTVETIKQANLTPAITEIVTEIDIFSKKYYEYVQLKVARLNNLNVNPIYDLLCLNYALRLVLDQVDSTPKWIIKLLAVKREINLESAIALLSQESVIDNVILDQYRNGKDKALLPVQRRAFGRTTANKLNVKPQLANGLVSDYEAGGEIESSDDEDAVIMLFGLQGCSFRTRVNFTSTAPPSSNYNLKVTQPKLMFD